MCFTQASPIFPAPRIITVLSLKSRSKTFSVNATTTLPTEVAPRPMAVFVRTSFAVCIAIWKSRFIFLPVRPASFAA